MPSDTALRALDLRALAHAGQALSGALELADLPRWRADAPDWPSAQPLQLHWQARAEWRDLLGAEAALASAPPRRAAHTPALAAAAAPTRARRSVPGAATRQLWLHLACMAQVPQTCQRCLEPLLEPIEVQRWFRFVASEAQAAAEDEQCSEDLLVGAARFDLLELIEDELLLALPLVPMHPVCPQPVHPPA